MLSSPLRNRINRLDQIASHEHLFAILPANTDGGPFEPKKLKLLAGLGRRLV